MSQPSRASLGFALIVKDGQKTLEACLKSIRPYCQQIVVAIDTLTTDKTRAIAKRYADVVVPVTVSEEHECPAHGKVLAQHFARARQESFRHLDPSLDWWAWIDADDVLEGAERLPELLGRKDIPPRCIGFWSSYEYAYVLKEDGTRVPNTVFDRERILRTHVEGQPVTWQWDSRVHETVRPVGVEDVGWAMLPQVRWVHQHQAHKSESSAPRNQLLLEIDLEEHPDDPRTVFYMGNGCFAVGDWPRAVEWYERYAALPEKNPHELWQSYVYMSLALERMGQLTDSLQAAFGAMDARPEYPEPYYRLASLYALMGQDEKAVYWTREGDRKEDAPFFAFKNPMDRTFNKYLPLSDALLRLGHLSEARRCLQEAVKTFPDERVMENLKRLEQKEMAEQAASDFVGMAKMLPEDTVLSMYEQLPQAVKTFGRTRNVAMSALRQRRRGLSQPKIVFWCGRSLEPWAPPTLTTTGIGGSETAVVKIAERFARAGWLVDVYNGADYMEGVYDGVGYWDPERLAKGEACDVFVSWRDPRAHSLPVQAKQRVLWCHDLNYGPDVAEDFAKWDLVLGVSGWHDRQLHSYYGDDVRRHKVQRETGIYPHFRTGWVPNGIDLERFVETKKVPWRCVYASSPDRGLDKVLAYWPAILQAQPEAELHIAYGWDNIDTMIRQGRDDLVAFRDDMQRRIDKTPNVVWRGRLAQDDLARLYCESYAWLYPCDFLEVSCISAMEAMAGCAVPVVTRAGALPETIGNAGFLVPGPPQSRAFGETWSKVAIGVLTDMQLRLSYAAKGRERAAGFTWDAAFDKWLQVLGLDVALEEAA